MDNIYINRVKVYNGTESERTICFSHMFRYYKNYEKKLGLDKIMKQPPKLKNIAEWRIKNWGCSSNALEQYLEADNTVFFETHDGFPLNVFKLLSVKNNALQISLLSWNREECLGHNYLLENGEIVKYNLISTEENEYLYQQMMSLFQKCYYDKI